MRVACTNAHGQNISHWCQPSLAVSDFFRILYFITTQQQVSIAERLEISRNNHPWFLALRSISGPRIQNCWLKSGPLASWWGILCPAFHPGKESRKPLHTSSNPQVWSYKSYCRWIDQGAEFGSDERSVSTRPPCFVHLYVLPCRPSGWLFNMEFFWGSCRSERALSTVGCCLVWHEIDCFWEGCCQSVGYIHIDQGHIQSDVGITCRDSQCWISSHHGGVLSSTFRD